jgi:hypothetical protein
MERCIRGGAAEFGVLEKRAEREIDSQLLSAPPDLKTQRQLCRPSTKFNGPTEKPYYFN